MERRNRKKMIPRILLFALAIGVVIVGIKMVTLDTELQYVQTYQFPALPSLDDLSQAEYGQQAVAIDGKIVFSKNNSGSPTHSVASTSKIILGLVVMDAKPFNLGEKGETIVISDEDYQDYSDYIAMNGSTTTVQVGEEYTEYDALALVLLASSNNIADTLARWAFGSMDEYHRYAMDLLKEWNISDIEFGSDASGYDPKLVGSAESMALIAQKFMAQPVLAEIVGLAKYEAQNVGAVSNTNQLLGIDRVNGLKTGFNGEEYSGYCLISSYFEPYSNREDDDSNHVVTIAMLGAPTRASSFTESQSIIEKVQEKYIPIEFVKDGSEVGYYDTWWTPKVSIISEEDLMMHGFEGAEKSVILSMDTDSENGKLEVTVGTEQNSIAVKTSEKIKTSPSIWERFLRIFGWER